MKLSQFPLAFDLIKRLSRLVRRSPIYECLDRLLGRTIPFTFFQIGVNDGISNDPYREFMIRPNARGIAVEPVHAYFSTAQKNYGNYPRVLLRNLAVNYPEAILPVFTFTDKFLESAGHSPELAGLAGVDRSKLVARLHPDQDAELCIQELVVPAFPIEQILEKEGWRRVDCLFLDCEGHEVNILLNLNYEQIQPRVIAFEHTHLSQNTSPVEAHLRAKGYVIERFQYDSVAMKLDW